MRLANTFEQRLKTAALNTTRHCFESLRRLRRFSDLLTYLFGTVYLLKIENFEEDKVPRSGKRMTLCEVTELILLYCVKYFATDVSTFYNCF